MKIEAAEAWIVVNIGCMECGVPSNIVAVMSDKVSADTLAEALRETHGWRHGGDNEFLVFPMPSIDVVAEEYLMAPAD